MSALRATCFLLATLADVLDPTAALHHVLTDVTDLDTPRRES